MPLFSHRLVMARIMEPISHFTTVTSRILSLTIRRCLCTICILKPVPLLETLASWFQVSDSNNSSMTMVLSDMMCPSLPNSLMLQMVKTLVQCSVLTRSRMMSSPSILQKLKLALRPSLCFHSTVSNGSKSFLPRRATATCTSTLLS